MSFHYYIAKSEDRQDFLYAILYLNYQNEFLHNYIFGLTLVRDLPGTDN